MGISTPPTPNLSGGIPNHQTQGSKCLHDKVCQKRGLMASLNFWLRPLFPAVLACGFPSGIIRQNWNDTEKISMALAQG